MAVENKSQPQVAEKTLNGTVVIPIPENFTKGTDTDLTRALNHPKIFKEDPFYVLRIGYGR
ncbi:MAG: hypothetical protein LBU87_03685 [Lactobacillales bacterium]|jgi:hypothetical protein|nr:hypothetical protein [Lactobacillales bacterium]